MLSEVYHNPRLVFAVIALSDLAAAVQNLRRVSTEFCRSEGSNRVR